MNKIALTTISILCVLYCNPLAVRADQDRLVIHFFGSRTCAECLEIKETILKPLAEEYPDVIELHLHEIEDKEALQFMFEMEERYGVERSSPQELFLPGDYLIGADAIMESGETLIREYLDDPGRWEVVEAVPAAGGEDRVKERFEDFTFAAIVLAGLVDGVNPCAIATMIFLISFLAVQKRSRVQIITVGLAFTAAVYVTYLSIGLGAFKFVIMLDAYRAVSLIIKWSAAGMAGIVGLLSIRDAVIYGKTGKTDNIVLQMPRSVKLRVHKLISGHLKGAHLIFGAVVTGFLVTLFEAICTGQVYLPAIIAMTKTAGSSTAGWMYLLFYNVLFVLPLLIVMILAGFGVTWHELAKTTQKNIPALKMLIGIVLIGLAVFLALA